MSKNSIGSKINLTGDKELDQLIKFDNLLTDLEKKRGVNYKYNLSIEGRKEAEELLQLFDEQSHGTMNDYFQGKKKALRELLETYEEYNEVIKEHELGNLVGEEYQTKYDKVTNSIVRQANAYMALGGELDTAGKDLSNYSEKQKETMANLQKIYNISKAQEKILMDKSGGAYLYTVENFEKLFDTMRKLEDFLEDSRGLSKRGIQWKMDLDDIQDITNAAKEAEEYLANVYEKYGEGKLPEGTRNEVLKKMGFLRGYYENKAKITHQSVTPAEAYLNAGRYLDIPKGEGRFEEEKFIFGKEAVNDAIGKVRKRLIAEAKAEMEEARENLLEGYQEAMEAPKEVIDTMYNEAGAMKKKVNYLQKTAYEKLAKEWGNFEGSRPKFSEEGEQGAYTDRVAFSEASALWQSLFDQIEQGALTSEEAIQKMVDHLMDSVRKGFAAPFFTEDMEKLLDQIQSLKDRIAELEGQIKSLEDENQDLKDNQYGGYSGYSSYSSYNSYNDREIKFPDLTPLVTALDGIKLSLDSLDINMDLTTLEEIVRDIKTDLERLISTFEDGGSIDINSVTNMGIIGNADPAVEARAKELLDVLKVFDQVVSASEVYKKPSKKKLSKRELQKAKEALNQALEREKILEEMFATGNFSDDIFSGAGTSNRAVGRTFVTAVSSGEETTITEKTYEGGEGRFSGGVEGQRQKELEDVKQQIEYYRQLIQNLEEGTETIERNRAKGIIKVSYDTILSSIFNNIQEVMKDNRYDFNVFYEKYNKSTLKDLPPKKAIERIGEILEWVRELSTMDVDDTTKTVIKHAIEVFPDISKPIEEQNNRLSVSDTIDQILKTLREMLKILNGLASGFGIKIPNDIPNLNDKFLSDRAQVLKDLYGKIDTKKGGIFSKKNTNPEAIKDFLRQFNAYGEGEWNLDEFARINNIPKENLEVLKQYNDELMAQGELIQKNNEEQTSYNQTVVAGAAARSDGEVTSAESTELALIEDKNKAFQEEENIVNSVIDNEKIKLKELEGSVDGVTNAVKRKTEAFVEEGKTVAGLLETEKQYHEEHGGAYGRTYGSVYGGGYTGEYTEIGSPMPEKTTEDGIPYVDNVEEILPNSEMKDFGESVKDATSDMNDFKEVMQETAIAVRETQERYNWRDSYAERNAPYSVRLESAFEDFKADVPQFDKTDLQYAIQFFDQYEEWIKVQKDNAKYGQKGQWNDYYRYVRGQRKEITGNLKQQERMEKALNEEVKTRSKIRKMQEDDAKYRTKMDKQVTQLQSWRANPAVSDTLKNSAKDLIDEINDAKQKDYVAKDIYNQINNEFKKLEQKAETEIASTKDLLVGQGSETAVSVDKLVEPINDIKSDVSSIKDDVKKNSNVLDEIKENLKGNSNQSDASNEETLYTIKAYRGTDEEGYGKLSSNASRPYDGTYYTRSYEAAKSYGDYVEEAILTLKNPLVLDAEGRKWNSLDFSQTTEESKRLVEELDNNIAEFLKTVKENFSVPVQKFMENSRKSHEWKTAYSNFSDKRNDLSSSYKNGIRNFIEEGAEEGISSLDALNAGYMKMISVIGAIMEMEKYIPFEDDNYRVNGEDVQKAFEALQRIRDNYSRTVDELIKLSEESDVVTGFHTSDTLTKYINRKNYGSLFLQNVIDGNGILSDDVVVFDEESIERLGRINEKEQEVREEIVESLEDTKEKLDENIVKTTKNKTPKEKQEDIKKPQGELPYLTDKYGNALVWYRGIYGDDDIGAFESERYNGATFWVSKPMIAASYGEEGLSQRIHMAEQASYNPYVLDAEGEAWNTLVFAGLSDKAKKIEEAYKSAASVLKNAGMDDPFEVEDCLKTVSETWDEIYPLLMKKSQGKIESVMSKLDADKLDSQTSFYYDWLDSLDFTKEELKEINTNLKKEGVVEAIKKGILKETKDVVAAVQKSKKYDSVLFKNMFDVGSGGAYFPENEEEGKEFLADILVQFDQTHTKNLGTKTSSQLFDETWIKYLSKAAAKELSGADIVDFDDNGEEITVSKDVQLFKKYLKEEKEDSVLRYFLSISDEFGQAVLDILNSDDIKIERDSSVVQVIADNIKNQLLTAISYKKSGATFAKSPLKMLENDIISATGDYFTKDKDDLKALRNRLKDVYALLEDINGVQEHYGGGSDYRKITESNEDVANRKLRYIVQDIVDGLTSRSGISELAGVDVLNDIMGEMIFNEWKSYGKTLPNAEDIFNVKGYTDRNNAPTDENKPSATLTKAAEKLVKKLEQEKSETQTEETTPGSDDSCSILKDIKEDTSAIREGVVGETVSEQSELGKTLKAWSEASKIMSIDDRTGSREGFMGTYDRERYMFVNTLRGELSNAFVTGLSDSITGDLIDKLFESDPRLKPDLAIHAHPDAYVFPSLIGGDLDTYYKQLKDGITQQIITARNHMVRFDLSKIAETGRRDDYYKFLKALEQQQFSFYTDTKEESENNIRIMKEEWDKIFGVGKNKIAFEDFYKELFFNSPKELTDNQINEFAGINGPVERRGKIYQSLLDIISGIYKISNTVDSINDRLSSNVEGFYPAPASTEQVSFSENFDKFSAIEEFEDWVLNEIELRQLKGETLSKEDLLILYRDRFDDTDFMDDSFKEKFLEELSSKLSPEWLNKSMAKMSQDIQEDIKKILRTRLEYAVMDVTDDAEHGIESGISEILQSVSGNITKRDNDKIKDVLSRAKDKVSVVNGIYDTGDLEKETQEIFEILKKYKFSLREWITGQFILDRDNVFSPLYAYANRTDGFIDIDEELYTNKNLAIKTNKNSLDKILDEYVKSRYQYLINFLTNKGYTNVNFNDISMRAFERGITTTPAPLDRSMWYDTWNYIDKKQTTDFNAMRDADFEKWKKANKKGKMSDLEYKKKFYEDYMNLIIRSRREAEDEDTVVWDDFGKKIREEYNDILKSIKEQDREKAAKEKAAKTAADGYLKGLLNVYEKKNSLDEYIYTDSARQEADRLRGALQTEIEKKGLSILEDPNNIKNQIVNDVIAFLGRKDLLANKSASAEDFEDILNKAKILSGKTLSSGMKTEVDNFVLSVEQILQNTELTEKELLKVKKDYSDLNVRAKEDIKLQEEKNRLMDNLSRIETRRNDEGNFYFTKNFRDEAARLKRGLENGTISIDQVKPFTSEIKDANNTVALQRDINKYITRGEKLVTQDYMRSETKKKFEALIRQLRQVGEEGGHSRVELNKLALQFQELEIEAAKTGKTLWGQVGQRLQDMNAKFIATYLSFHDIVRYGKAVINTVTELDTALTEMRKVSDESVESLKRYQKTTFDTASALGTTAVQLQQSTADWLRLGESMEEASKSAVAATTLLNVSEFDSIDKATEALVSMSQAYKDLDKTEIIDVMNNIGNNYAIATDELATALQASASALVTQGNDLYEAAALVTAGNAVIQDASKVGTGIRTIALRIAGVKEGDDEVRQELEELGEEVDDWVVSTEAKKRKVIMDYTRVASNAGQGVDILDSNGNLKDTYEILLEISKVYKEIQEEDKKNGTNRAQGLVEELAGKVRSNVAASILMNPELLENVYNSALDSSGSAAEENAKYLDSIIGKTQQFKNELQELESNIINSEVIKDVISFGTAILKLINKLDKALPPLVALLGSVAFGIKNARSEWIKFAQVNEAGVGKDFFGDNLLSKMAKKLTGVGDIKNYGIKFGAELREELSKYFDLSYVVDKFKKDSESTTDITQLATDFVKTIEGTSGELAQSIRDSDAFQDIRDAIVQGIDPTSAVEDFVDNSGDLKEALGEDAQALIEEGLGSLTELTTAQEEVTVATESATGAVTAFNGVIGTLGAFGLSAAVTLITMGIRKLITYSAELEEKARVASETIKTVKEELKDNDKYIKDVQREFVALSRGVDDLGNNITLSNDQFDRYNDIANEIAERFPTMVDGWTAEGNAIIGVANSVQELDEAYKKYRQDQLAEAADKKNIDAAAKDLVNFTEKNYWEQLGSTFTSFWINNEHVKKTGYGIDYRTQEAFLDDIAQMSIEEFNKKINEDKKYRLAISRYFSDSTFEAMTGGISGDEMFEWTAKEEGDKYKSIASVSPQMFAVLQKQARSELSQVNQKLNEKLKSFQEALEVTFEFNLSYSDTFLDAQTQVIAEQIIDNLDANFLTQLAQDTTMANAFTDTLIEALGNVDNQALASLYTVKSDDVNYKKAEEELLTAWKKIYDDVMAQMADATPEEKLQLSNILNTIWESSGMAEFTEKDDAFQRSLAKIAGNDAQAKAYLEEYTKDFTINNMQLWLEVVRETDSATEAVERYNNALKGVDDTFRTSDIKHLFSQDTIVDKNRFDSTYNSLLNEYDRAVKEGEGADYLDELQKKIDTLEESFDTWGDVKTDLMGLAQAGKLDEDTFKNYKYFEKILKALGVSAEDTDEALKTIIDDINQIAGNNEVDKFANAKADLDKLNNAYQAFKQGNPIDATTLNEVQDTFAYLGASYRDFENAVMTGEQDLQSYFDELISQYIIQEGLLDNLNESNREWVEQQLEGYGLTKKSAEEMTSKAIENNKELDRSLLNTTQKLNNIVALSTKTQNKIANATSIDELDTKEISDLVTAVLAEDSGATEAERLAAQDLALYALQKALAGDKSLENEEDIEYLSDLIAACNVATEAVKQLARAKKLEASIAISTNAIQDVLNSNMSESEKDKAIYSLQMAIDLDTKELDSIDLSAIGEEAYKEVIEAWRKKDPNRGLKGIYGGLSDANESAAEEAYQKAKELLEKLLALYDAELAAGTITVQEYVEKSRRLIEEYYNDGKIKAADYYGYLESLAEKEKNQYDKVIAAVQKLIQNQIKELEKQKEAIEENYNTQIEAIQEKIDAIQDENEEIDKNMALQKAQYNLNRALNQKTKLMYSESRGFYYTVDTKGVQDAEEELRKAQQDKLIYEYQKEIERLQEEMKKATEAIDEQIKKLNEYSEMWGEVASQLEDSMNAQIAAQILGQDWEQKILDQRLDTLQDFTDKYIELQKEQIKWALLRAEAEANGGSSSGGTSSSSVSGVTASSWEYNGKGDYTQEQALEQQEKDAQAEYDKYMYEHRGAPAWAIPKLEKEARKKKEEWKKNHPVTPSYFKGTSSAQRGESLVGEFGSEIVLHKNGTASIVDSPTLMDMEGGEKVFNAKETEDILKSKYKPLKNVNPKKFAMLHAFASGTSSPMQSMIAAQAVGIANGLKNGLVPALATTGGNQTINQTFNVSLPNITDSSKAQDLFKEFEQLQRKATQFFN